MTHFARSAPVEPRSSWYAVAALVLAMLAYTGWLTLGGTSPGRIPGSWSASPILTVVGGQRGTFRPGRMDEGSVIACTNSGLQISAAVPARGRFVEQHVDSPLGRAGATIAIVHRTDGSVSYRCTA